VSRRRTPVLVSAHGGGTRPDPGPAPETLRTALERSVGLGVDYVELDVRRSRDGVLVLCHDPRVRHAGRLRAVADLDAGELREAIPGLLTLDDALQVLAGRAHAHLDLKFRSPGATHELAAAARAAEVLGPDGILVTTGDDDAVRTIHDWAATRGRPLAGLSIGGSVAGRPVLQQLRMRLAELFPERRLAGCRADAVVANHWLALLRLRRVARRAGLPLVVWTVDHPVVLRHWMRPGRAWLVTTNRPERALAIRAAHGRHPARPHAQPRDPAA
jgi:glycerophosphoryl diester phosphodiesterase